MADRRAVRRRQGRGQPQPGRPRLLRRLDAGLHARLAVAGGRPRRSARRPARRGCATSSPPAASRASGARPRRPSTSCSKRVREHYDHRRDGAAAVGHPCARADQGGFVEHDGVRVAYECLATGDRRSSACRAGRSSTRQWRAQVPYLARHCRVVTFDPRGNGGSDAPRSRLAYASPRSLGTRSPCWTPSGSSGRRWWGVERRRAGAQARRRASGACDGRWPSSGGRAAFRAPSSQPTSTPGTSTRAGSASNGILAARLRGLRRVVLRRRCSRSRTRRGRSRRGLEWAAGRPARSSPGRSTRPELDEARDARLAAACAAPCSSSTATRTHPLAPRGRELAAETGGRLVTMAGSGHAPNARDPVRVNLLLREFLLPPRRPPAGGGRAPARRARSSSRRRSAWGTCGATSRSRRSCGGCGRGSRSTGSPNRRRRAARGRAASAIHPASAELAAECAHIES